jgi:hypothetical protein
MIPFWSDHDGTEELCTLPKCKSDLETSKDRAANMQRVFLQSIRNRSPQYDHRVEALQTGRPRRHRSIWGKRWVRILLLSYYIKTKYMRRLNGPRLRDENTERAVPVWPEPLSPLDRRRHNWLSR